MRTSRELELRTPSFELLIDRLPDATVLIDTSGVVQWANLAAEKRLGRPRADWIGDSCLELIHPDDLETALLSMSSVQGKDIGTPIELRIRTSAGWRLAEVIGAPVGETGHILLSMRDLTERRRWEVATDETAKLRTLVHHAPTLFVLLDLHGRVQATSGAITRLLGHDQAAVEDRPITDLVEPADRARLQSAIDRAVHRGVTRVVPERVEVRLRHARRGTGVPYELTVVDLTDDPTVGGVLITGHDVSERTATEEDLRDMLSLLNATLDSTADGILVVDLSGHITSFNARFVDMWAVPLDIVASGIGEQVLQHASRQLADPTAFAQKVRELHAEPETESFDILVFADGRILERYSTPQRVGGEVVGRVWSFHDVTRQKQLERELEHQAFHDSLTGLANHARFSDRVEQALVAARADRREIAVLYFDIDDFKLVNDSLGHPAGDQILVAVSERLRRCVRDGDTIARLGGDEFAVLVEQVDARETAIEMAGRIIDAFRRPVRIGTRELITSVSVGIAFSEAGVDTEQMLRNADLAMYAAKRRGKARHELYVAGMHAEAIARLEMEADLHLACAREEFWIAYQPIVELRTARIVGFEALVRWQHPEWGEVGPDVFISAAEDIGVIGEISEFVLHRACAQMQRWAADAADELSLSVNVSARQLMNGSVVTQVADALASSGLDPFRLVLELTETAMLHDTRSASRSLAELKALGVRLALDDFGTGYSSLTHLQQFPIDIIKIDRSFMTTTGQDAALIRAVIRMSQELGLRAIAEGIETADHVAFLQDAGCEFGQGYFFARPAHHVAMDRLVSSWPE